MNVLYVPIVVNGFGFLQDCLLIFHPSDRNSQRSTLTSNMFTTSSSVIHCRCLLSVFPSILTRLFHGLVLPLSVMTVPCYLQRPLNDFFHGNSSQLLPSGDSVVSRYSRQLLENLCCSTLQTLKAQTCRDFGQNSNFCTFTLPPWELWICSFPRRLCWLSEKP